MSSGPAIQDVIEFAESVADEVAFELSEQNLSNVSNSLNAHIGDLTDDLLSADLERAEAEQVALVVIDKILTRIEQYQKMPVGHA